MNVQPIKFTLKRDGFVIVPAKYFAAIKAELKKQKVDTTHLYSNPPEDWNTVMAKGDFAIDDSEGTPKLVLAIPYPRKNKPTK